MARTTEPTKDRRYAPRREDDRPGYWAGGIADRLVWPLTLTFLAILGGTAAVWLRYGEARAIQLLDFLQGPAFLGVVSVITFAAISVLRKVPQLGRFEKRQAVTQASVESTGEELARTREEFKTYLVEVVKLLKDSPAGAAPEVASKMDTITGVVRDLAARMARIEATSAAAATNSASTLDTVVHYGGNLEAIASMATTTGDLRARTEAAGQSARDSLRATQTASPGESFPAPPSGRPRPAADPLDTSQPWHRDPTAAQPAVSAADEQEDWQPGSEDDDGPGLDTGYRNDFRAAMEAADRETRNPYLDERLLARPTQPAPRFPRPEPDDARRQMLRRQDRWDNPEEGPR